MKENEMASTAASVESPTGANTVEEVKPPIEATKTASGKKYYDNQGELRDIGELEPVAAESAEAQATADGAHYYDAEGKLQSTGELDTRTLDPAVVGFVSS